MNILFDLSHPAHVHLFRNVICNLKNDGHRVYVTVKDIPSAEQLLDLYDIPYECIGRKHDSIHHKAIDQILYDFKLWWFAIIHRIDIGIHGITIAHVSKFCSMQSILPDDDDDGVEPLFAKYAHPFANVILSPEGTFRKSKNVVYYASFHELSYLHPNSFQPDPSVLEDAGIKVGDPFFILRFNAFKAHHDANAQGLSLANKRKLINYLQSKGKVFITTERDIDEEWRPYQLKVSPDKAHSLLYYATMFIGDSQTMTSEAAVLGTPAIRCNTFVGKIHYLEEEEHRYGLTFGFRPDQSEAMFHKIDEILSLPNPKQIWNERRQRMLAEKIDYAQFLTWFIESYPDSERIMRENPDYQWRFK